LHRYVRAPILKSFFDANDLAWANGASIAQTSTMATTTLPMCVHRDGSRPSLISDILSKLKIMSSSCAWDLLATAANDGHC
jgi:hypothetical protein